MNDLPKIGTVVVVDAETIGRVMKTTEDEVVVHCLSFPFFRVIKANNYDVATIKVADSEQRALQQLVLPTLNKDWSMEAWEAEIDDIVEYVLDDLEENLDDVDISRESVRNYIMRRCTHYARQSDWYTEAEGQERSIRYCLYYLEIDPDTIIKAIPENERHISESVRKASALVHLSKDIYESVLETLDEDVDDDDEYNDEDDLYGSE